MIDGVRNRIVKRMIDRVLDRVIDRIRDRDEKPEVKADENNSAPAPQTEKLREAIKKFVLKR